jgi:hypothetical protein
MADLDQGGAEIRLSDGRTDKLAEVLQRVRGTIEAPGDASEPLSPRFYRFDADEVEVPVANDELWPLESLLLAPETEAA